MRAAALSLCFGLAGWILAGCGNSGAETSGLRPDILDSLPAAALTALPVDGVQPWEQVDSRGFVIPESRRVAALPSSAEIVYGDDRFQDGGEVVPEGLSLQLRSDAGSTALSWATYRLPLGGQQPGAIGIDAGLVFHDTPGASIEYYVALSDYGHNYWAWLGPFSEPQITLSVPDGDWLSPLGNTFVAIATVGGSEVSVIAVTASPRDTADNTPPPTPPAPNLNRVAGGLEVTWSGVIASDLAGYRVLRSYSPFDSPTDPGVKTINYLEGTRRLLLPADGRTVFVALQAVDLSGNASGMSLAVSALPRPGTLVRLAVDVDQTSALRGELNTLSATGAALYDFDLDGDGVFEVVDNATGEAPVDTSTAGLIRPRVRGHNEDGTVVALGSISVVVSGNSRPVASARVDPQSGVAPLSVNFFGEGFDDDGTIVEWAWDRTGDGIYERISASNSDETGTFSAPGLYNAKLRVKDDQGAIDIDTVSVLVHAQELSLAASPAALELGSSTTLSANAPGLSVATYLWDLDDDGIFEVNTGNQGTLIFSPPHAGDLPISVMAQLTGGGNLTAGVTVRAQGVRHSKPAATISFYSTDAESVLGLPAVMYAENTGLHYVRATGPDTWGAPVIVDPLPACLYPSLEMVDGHPAVAYYHADELKFVRAADPTGTTWNPPQVLDTFNNVGAFVSLAIVDGHPALAYRDVSLTDPMYWRAADTTGSAWGANVNLQMSADDSGYGTSLAVIDGFPAVSWNNETVGFTQYRRATDAQGTAWGTIQTAPSTSSQSQTSLVQVQSRPGIFSMNATPTPFFLLGDDADGNGWGSPRRIDLNDNGINMVGKVIGGVPCALYLDNNNFLWLLSRARDPLGQAWDREIVGNASTYAAGSRSAGLTSAFGQPAGATIHGFANTGVDFFISY